MSIERFYKTTFSYSRMVWVGDSSGEVVQGTFKGHLQQADQELIESVRQSFTLTHTIWCDNSVDVQSGDKIELSGDTYSVRAIQNNGFVGNNKHLELLLEKDVSQE